MMGKNGKAVEFVEAGNVLGIMGIDKFITKSVTLTDEKEVDASPFIRMSFSVSPVVRIALKTVNPADQPALIDGLKKLEKSDPLVQWEIDEASNIVVSGAGELHLEIILKDLRDDYCTGIKITTSLPAVTFTETVTETSQICLAKSANKLNRVFASCSPLSDELVKVIEDGTLDVTANPKKLVDYGWDSDLVKKIWARGPGPNGTCFLVDLTKGVDYIMDIKDHIIQAFNEVVVSGVLAGEKMRGIVFNLHDFVIHTDSSHRGGRQFTPAAKRAFYACQLTGSPRLVEPIFKVDISVTEDCVGPCYSVVNKRRGTVLGIEVKEGTPLRVISCYIPVMESFGLTELLRSVTSGKALPQCSFDHWELWQGDPLEVDSKVAVKISEIRKRKEMTELEIPPLSRYLDKL
jgi:elongation factor 2